MIDLLEKMSHSLWSVDLLSLLLLVIIATKQKSSNSSLVTVIVILTLGMLMLGFEALLKANSDNVNIENSLLNFIWYMGFASFGFLMLRSLRWGHQFCKVPFGSIARCYNWAIFALASLQIMQYLEILLFSTRDKFAYVYCIGIPLINIATSVFCLTLAIVATVAIIRDKHGLETFRWAI